ncbi:MAG: glycosyltransferase [Nostoc sp. TH1S01]|nr:glycosyltransferase [Nostoc sp. TH1S01]
MQKFTSPATLHSSNTNNVADSSQPKRTLLCITHDLPPLKTPIANRAKKLLEQFQQTWQLKVLTGTKNAVLNEDVSMYYAKTWYPQGLIELLSKLRLEKFLSLLIWPESNIFWVIPAIIKGYRIIQKHKPDAIFVLMMPYSAGLVGICLKWLTGLPLILSLDDSPTCTDMHPDAMSWLHNHLDYWLENFYVRQSDAIVYVSQFNLNAVKNRQHSKQQSKLHLIRCGADPQDFAAPISTPVNHSKLEIVYTGGMNGWYQFYHHNHEKTLLKKLYQAWMELGYYKRATIDYRSSSPVFAGQAIKQVLAQHPEWQKNVHLAVYGNSFPEFVVQRVLENQNLTDVVSVFNSLPHFQAIQLARQADLLFITLPNRPDGSSGGRISCKTYEYLMTDRPILAAVPQGENWDYLQDKPGVWLVEPTDTEAMCQVIATVAKAQFSGNPLRFDRSHLQAELSYINLVKDYLQIFDEVCSKTVITK